jgi:hypothetical protein
MHRRLLVTTLHWSRTLIGPCSKQVHPTLHSCGWAFAHIEACLLTLVGRGRSYRMMKTGSGQSTKFHNIDNCSPLLITESRSGPYKAGASGTHVQKFVHIPSSSISIAFSFLHFWSIRWRIHMLHLFVSLLDITSLLVFRALRCFPYLFWLIPPCNPFATSTRRWRWGFISLCYTAARRRCYTLVERRCESREADCAIPLLYYTGTLLETMRHKDVRFIMLLLLLF